MDIASILGLVVGLAIVVVVLYLDGGSPEELFAAPSAILLTMGGAIAATTISSNLSTLLKLPVYFKIMFTTKKEDVAGLIEQMVRMADKARKEGLLALEEDSRKIEDEFLKRGIMMVVDGIDPAQVRAILETGIEQMRTRHRAGAGFFAAAGGYAPTFGIIGTVMGLISVLKALDDPSKLAESIAVAFLATLWGLLSSNMIFLPIGAKLKMKSEEEAHVKYLVLEGILSIQAGENPRVVRDKLNSYLPPSKKAAEGDEKASGKSKAKAKQPQSGAA
jgi:chemotaxis protein MotA